MSRKERVIAGLLLVVAVLGGAVLPRLLASPATTLGIALGPSPGPSIVQAPTIHTTPRHVTARHTLSPVPAGIAVSSAPVTPVVVQPKPAASTATPKHVPAPSPAPPATATPPSPAPLPAPPPAQLPAATAHQGSTSNTPPGHAKTPPGLAKKPSPRNETPPVHATTPPGHAKTPPANAKPLRAPGPPPSAKPETAPGRSNGAHDLRGSGHGRPVKTPPHAVGSHHRGVGHLAPPPAGSAQAAPGGGPQARPKARGPRSKSGVEPPPQVANGHGQNGNGKGRGD